ncbi:thioesterase II family protein [Streptomyces silvensis]|uniref:Gramicidin biosynthesis protein n=1 Tax=Streptomyces silvensis TaxID=1765722 RepID=A0A0W7X0R4_9ACTN|nr:thioesterase domain-containing protein [Streptomyces silvensis]KUF16413.1 gramicidin biosynthesis protein [Streptomyces silvensis]
MRTQRPGLKGRLVPENRYLWRARRPDAEHRIICFPHAGGGANAYAHWARALPEAVELATVQLPGRQNRIGEAPATDVGRLVQEIIAELRPALSGPFSFFGHSCGSLLAFEVARALQRRGGPRPAHLFLSAQSTPDVIWAGPKLHELPEQEFHAAVLSLGGFDEEVSADQEVMDELVPVVLADFQLWERHRIARVPALDCPVTALVGASDWRAPQETMAGWSAYTSAPFTTQVFPGGHFYLTEEGNDVPGFVGRALLGA